MGQGRLGPSRFRCLSSRTLALHARFVRPCLRLAQGLSVQCRLAQAPLNTPSESILCAKLSGHGGSAVSAAVVLDDSPTHKHVVTAGLDKLLVLWETQEECLENDCMAGYFESCRLIVPGGPAFSLSMHQGSEQIKNFGAADKKQVYLGTHGKEVLAWDPKLQALEAGVSLTGHCGWVRALTSCGDRWLFSAACNHLHQWDMARAVPSAASSVSLEKGDITALTCDKRRLFVASADGALRSFDVDPRRGTLTPASSRPKAHSDRITALTLDNNLLFSAAYDGSVKAWDPATLEIVAAIHGAHGGERIHCLALGPGQLLYSGGGDCLVRRWSRHVLAEAAVPLHAHSHAVNALAFGGVETLVSGDKGGEIAMWKVC